MEKEKLETLLIDYIDGKLNDAERQLKQIGRPRARQLYRWLLAADLATKDYNSSIDRARRVLETLILRLSQQAGAASPR